MITLTPREYAWEGIWLPGMKDAPSQAFSKIKGFEVQVVFGINELSVDSILRG
jgi:hypothetical protein